MDISIVSMDTEVLQRIDEYLSALLTEEQYRRKTIQGNRMDFRIVFRSDTVEILTQLLERFPGADVSASATYSDGSSGYQSWTTVRYFTKTDENGKRYLEYNSEGGWA